MKSKVRKSRKYPQKDTGMTNSFTKYSTLLITREVQIKAMERYYYILTRMTVIKEIDNTKCEP